MTDRLHDALGYDLVDGVAKLMLDDGKANALSPELVAALAAAIDRAEADEAGAVLLIGREGRFSAGFDLAAMTASPESMRELVTAGARFLMRLYTYPRPVVAACTGHALAAGAMLLLACDVRVGAEGQFKIGLNEVAIGMGLPMFVTELARDRLGKRHFPHATALARVYAPVEAVDVGFLDRVVPAAHLVPDAFAEAARLAELPGPAVAYTKRASRQPLADRILESLDADLHQLRPPRPPG